MVDAPGFASSAQAARTPPFDARDLRGALGQFSTGVAVVTLRAADGRRIGVTVNSFASVSLDPPLVLWSLARTAPSAPDFIAAQRFAIHVLAADQHALSRRFATPMADKFDGVAHACDASGLPLLDGVIGRFVCRNARQYDGGDHVIFIGAVESYAYFDGEPLLFYGGRYHVAARHPALVD